MKSIYYCEKCGREFHNESACIEHEEICGIEKTFTCDKCGKVETWQQGDVWDFATAESCHTIELGQMGYGSSLDGCNVNFNLCDDCLRAFIESFTLEGQEKVLNSGSNTYMSTEDWLKEARGEFTDEDYEEHHMYSPRQIKAYEERYPKCDNVEIYIHSDGSSGSHCHKPDFHKAFGDSEGKCHENNCSSECFKCEYFIERPEGKEIKTNILTKEEANKEILIKIKQITEKIKNKKVDD